VNLRRFVNQESRLASLSPMVLVRAAWGAMAAALPRRALMMLKKKGHGRAGLVQP